MDVRAMIQCAVNKHTAKVTTTLASRSPSSTPSVTKAAGPAKASPEDTRKRKRSLEAAEPETLDLTADDSPYALSSPVTPMKRARAQDTILADHETQNPTAYAASFAIANTPPPSDTVMSEAAPPTTEDRDDPVPQPATGEATPSGLPTPRSTPIKPIELHERGELDNRYLSRTSTAEGVEFKVPNKFCLKPPFWTRWTSDRYASFADYLREQFDPVPFAKQQGIPVEEVQHAFDALVCNPLYNAKEAKRRGEHGMQKLFHLANQLGTPMRYWGNPNKEMVCGELGRVVEKGVVELILESGSKYRMSLSQLEEDDQKYLKEALTEPDKKVFSGEARADREMRHWGHPRPQDQKRLYGCSVSTEKGVVVLKTKLGTLYRLIVQSLVEEDLQYLDGALSAGDKRVLWGA